MGHINEKVGVWLEPGKRGYHSLEYTAAKLLKFMINKRELGPFSIYRLMRFEAGRWQRRDRIHLILDKFRKLGWVETVPGKITRYQVTEEGEMAYPWVQRVLEFSEGIKFGKRLRFPVLRVPSEDEDVCR
jgi:hypothetical protein